MKTLNPRFLTMAGIVLAVASPCTAAGRQASPTPTPRPGTLAEAAARITLNKEGATDGTGRIVITDDTISSLADRGKVVTGPPVASGLTLHLTDQTPAPSARSIWRKRVLAQKRVIADLDRKRLAVERQIEIIESGRLTVRSLARLERAKLGLRSLEEETRREDLQLRRLIREARRHGAEPGWFR